VAVRRRVWHEDIGPGVDLVLLAIEDELGAPFGDEVELLVAELRALGVRLDDVDPGLLGRIGVRAERLDPEREPDGTPSQRPRAWDRLDLLEPDDLWRARAQKTGVSV
jgi:hypothetical protein